MASREDLKRIKQRNSLLRQALASDNVPDDIEDRIAGVEAGTISMRNFLKPADPNRFVTTGNTDQDVTLESNVRKVAKKGQAPRRQTKEQRQERQEALTRRNVAAQQERARIKRDVESETERQRVAQQVIDQRRRLEIKKDVEDLLNIIEQKEEDVTKGPGFLDELFNINTAEDDQRELDEARARLDEVLGIRSDKTEEEERLPAGAQFLQELSKPQNLVPNEFASEEEARAAGFDNGDVVIINGVRGVLE